MQTIQVKPGDRLVKNYYDVLGQLGQLHIDHEMAVRSAFQGVLSGYTKKLKWTFVPEFGIKTPAGRISVDGAILDSIFRRGFWEAKDERDDLEREIKAKIARGYPTSNIIFQAPERAILYQRGIRKPLNEDIRDPKNLSDLLNEFFAYEEPIIEEWNAALAEFKDRLPEIAGEAEKLIEQERRRNKAFAERFESFYELCRQAINPGLTQDTVEKMLVQHLLTERIFRKVFENEEFRTQNVIAQEIEKVISALVMPKGGRDQFLASINHFYKTIERAAEQRSDYSEKQELLNTVYERFFQGYSPKEADTHGIVYTPQPIVDFMVRSVEDILKKEFGKSLSDKGVHILDPFVGTGNFITRVMREIKKTALPYKYENELHCNEVMLMPYYIASMNIAHQYQEQTGEYKEFPGICLVDTFELAEPEQATLGFMNEENTARVKRQKDAPIFVVIGNPPYNVGQVDESEQNKNRKYPVLDRRVAETFVRDSTATLRNKLSDPYVKAIRWASDRLGNEGVVAFVTNNSFIEQIAFDGMRKDLAREFDCIYILDLGGNVRKNPKLSGTTHNVFGIQVGVSIAFLVRHSAAQKHTTPMYAKTGEDWRKEDKYKFLESANSVVGIEWKPFHPTENGDWVSTSAGEYDSWTPMGSKTAKRALIPVKSIFQLFSLGVVSNRDAYVYNFDKNKVGTVVRQFIQIYNSAVDRLIRNGETLETVVDVSDSRIKWTRQVKASAERRQFSEYKGLATRPAVYRPFCVQYLYFDDFWNEEQYQSRSIFPKPNTKNVVICTPSAGGRAPYWCFASGAITSLTLTSIDGTQCFPFYVYDEDSSNRRENITDWALNEFRTQYKDKKITKLDIFHYVYGLLHSPEYRERYAANLKRELPRIPYAPDFWVFAKAGERLADLHVNYEKQPEYPLEKIENPNEKLNWRVEKMRLGRDKTSILYNSFLTLSGIPPETFEYRLGNRSALEWVIDQYQVSTDKRSGITNDPNRDDDPEYIVRLIGQVIYVSLETVKIVKSLPSLGIEQARNTHA